LTSTASAEHLAAIIPARLLASRNGTGGYETRGVQIKARRSSIVIRGTR
jgi:hypothetical protein